MHVYAARKSGRDVGGRARRWKDSSAKTKKNIYEEANAETH